MAAAAAGASSLLDGIFLYCRRGSDGATATDGSTLVPVIPGEVGSPEDPRLQAALSAGEFRSFISLLSTAEEAQRLKASIEGASLSFRHIALDAPTSLTTNKAMQIHAELTALPRPVWLHCADCDRAYAAVLLHEMIAHGGTPEEALCHLSTEDKEIRSWVMRTLVPPAGTDLSGAQARDLIFRQLFDPVSCTYTYILADPSTREAIIIDPVLEKVPRDVQTLTELGLQLVYALNTHVHADHISGTHALKTKLAGVKSVVAASSHAAGDVHVDEGDVVSFGGRHVRVLATPGHTDGCLTFVLDDSSMAFTGDALFVRGCGRTDFQQGSAERLYDSIHEKIFTLPENCVIFPGHDYQGNQRSTVAEEVRYNPRLTKSKQEFVALMRGLNLARPKMIDIAVPANMKDGEVESIPAVPGEHD